MRLPTNTAVIYRSWCELCFSSKLNDMHAYLLLVGARVPAKGDIKEKDALLQLMKASTEDVANAKTTARLDNRATK